MEDISNYLVKIPKQVINYLKTLSTEKCLIAAKFGENKSFLTAILEIDEKKQVIIIDCGPKEYLNKELLCRGIVECTADYKGIKVLFQGRGIKKAGKTGQPALSIKIPTEIYWIQRRKFYRVRSPLSKESYCTIPIPNDISQDPVSINFKLYNLSISGLSIISEDIENTKQFSLNTKYSHCTLVLDNTESHTLTLIPRDIVAINPNNPKKGHRIGCEFVDITPRIENACSRYMQNIEREIKKNFDRK